MICPNCGFVDKEIPVPEITKKARILGRCKKCEQTIFCIPSQKRGETSSIETVKKGEAREEHLLKIYLKYYGGKSSKKRPGSSDIDRDILDEKGQIICHLEIKERSNTINAYKETQFPFAKIEEAKRLTKENGKPVFIVLKFADCWARIRIDPNKKYKKGSKPFAPRYRPWQRFKKRQIPVQIDVEELEILNIREECGSSFQVQ
jgi:hypothetical protein